MVFPEINEYLKAGCHQTLCRATRGVPRRGATRSHFPHRHRSKPRAAEHLQASHPPALMSGGTGTPGPMPLEPSPPALRKKARRTNSMTSSSVGKPISASCKKKPSCNEPWLAANAGPRLETASGRKLGGSKNTHGRSISGFSSVRSGWR